MAHGMSARLLPHEGLRAIRALGETTDHWGFVQGLYLGGNDCGVAMRFLEGYDYEPQSRALWRKLCTDAQIVIDVGAHTGVYSLDAFAAGARRVISIEPNPLCYARLLLNLHHAKRAVEDCFMCAAHDQNVILEFSRGGNRKNYCNAGGLLGPSPFIDSTIPMRAIRLDDAMQEGLRAKVAVVKMDTEGHNVAVLRGMSAILAHRPDLILECIEPGMDDILSPLGYRFYRINEHTGLSPVESLTPDEPISHDSPNRYASVKVL